MSNENRRAIPASEKGERIAARLSSDAVEFKTTIEDVEYYTPLIKSVTDEQIVIGVVLQPDIVDAQGTLIPESVITKAAHDFLSKYNDTTKLGEQHVNFKKQFDLLESAVAPGDIMIGDKLVKKGSWYIVVKVKEADTWQRVKDGEITGFSIGGKARAKRVVVQEV